MQYIADLHIHSGFSRACSKALTLENIEETCKLKGVDIVAMADWTHPEWFRELSGKLEETKQGLYQVKDKYRKKLEIRNDKLGGNQVYFFPSTEVSLIYSKGGKCRRLHISVFAPNLDVVDKINQRLKNLGANLKADGRPIMGLSCERLAEVVLGASEDCMIVPSHIWTPWFAMFGSKSGFDSIEECWGEWAPKIHAIETGLSSDPPMNWRVSNLDKVTIISNSDAHSLPNIAREGNIFEMNPEDLNYNNICNAIKSCVGAEFTPAREGDNAEGRITDRVGASSIPTGDPKLIRTIEFFPEEGMYHFDGHRVCDFSCTPQETKKLKGVCPKCKKPLTVGVDYRVEELADREVGYEPKDRIPFYKLVELDKIIADSLGIKSRRSKQVQAEWQNLIEKCGAEFDILLNVSKEELLKVTQPIIVEGIVRVRDGKIKLTPGHDGVYGKIEIFTDDERDRNKQGSLF